LGTGANKLADGPITVSAVATDAAGNVSTPATSSFTLDTFAPTATLTNGSGLNTGSATVQSTEAGTAFLIKNGLVSGTPATLTDLSSVLTAGDDLKWNSIAITSPNTNTSLNLAGLEAGTYTLFAADAAGNLAHDTLHAFTVGAASDTTPAKFVSVQLEGTPTVNQGRPLITDTGDTIHFSITMNEAVQITGVTPGDNSTFRMGIQVGIVQQSAMYEGLSADSKKILFSYTVKDADFDSNGVFIDPAFSSQGLKGLQFGGAVIKDLAGNSSSQTAGGDLAYGGVTDIAAAKIGVLDLGLDSSGQKNGLLIRGIQADGKSYYVWDLNSDGVIDVDDKINWAKFASILPTIESLGLSALEIGASTALTGTGPISFSGTAVNNGAADNVPYRDLLAIWDAYNGSGTSSNVAATIPNWAAGGTRLPYWATDAATQDHWILDMLTGTARTTTLAAFAVFGI